MDLLKGKKIRLRALEPEDVEFLYSIENDTAMWDVGCTSTPYSRFALNSYVMGNTADIFADKQMRLMIESLEGVSSISTPKTKGRKSALLWRRNTATRDMQVRRSP